MTKDSSTQNGIITILADTREQLDYQFSQRVSTKRACLPAGDYSIDGYQSEIAVERKTLNDFVNSIILHRERFKKELLKLQTYSLAFIIVEADARAIFDHQYSSNVAPAAVWGSALSIIIDYGIPIYFLSNRHTAIKFIEDCFIKFVAKRKRDREQSITAERRKVARDAVNSLLPSELQLPFKD